MRAAGAGSGRATREAGTRGGGRLACGWLRGWGPATEREEEGREEERPMGGTRWV
jgi:hypothetical protein